MAQAVPESFDVSFEPSKYGVRLIRCRISKLDKKSGRTPANVRFYGDTDGLSPVYFGRENTRKSISWSRVFIPKADTDVTGSLEKKVHSKLSDLGEKFGDALTSSGWEALLSSVLPSSG